MIHTQDHCLSLPPLFGGDVVEGETAEEVAAADAAEEATDCFSWSLLSMYSLSCASWDPGLQTDCLLIQFL